MQTPERFAPWPKGERRAVPLKGYLYWTPDVTL
jgi:hypothetical protein